MNVLNYISHQLGLHQFISMYSIIFYILVLPMTTTPLIHLICQLQRNKFMDLFKGEMCLRPLEKT